MRRLGGTGLSIKLMVNTETKPNNQIMCWVSGQKTTGYASQTLMTDLISCFIQLRFLLLERPG